MIRRLTYIVAFALLSSFFLSYINTADAAPPLDIFTFQGILKDDGVLINDIKDFTLRIYNTPSSIPPPNCPSGDCLWEENQTNIGVKNGVFTIFAGNTTSFVDRLNFTEAYYMEVTVKNPDETLTPRISLTAAPFALAASSASGDFASANLNVTNSLDIGNSGIPNDYKSIIVRHGSDSGGGYFVQRDGNDPFVAFAGFDFDSSPPFTDSRTLFIGGGNRGADDANQIRFYTDPTYAGGINEGVFRMVINTDGNVGIGTLGPNDALDVVGNIDATGCIEVDDVTTVGGTCISDERLKKNIREPKSVLSEFVNMDIKEFDWIENDKSTIGVIAQQVLETSPERVELAEDGYYRVATPTPYELLQAIQELNAKVDSLKSDLILSGVITDDDKIEPTTTETDPEPTTTETDPEPTTTEMDPFD